MRRRDEGREGGEGGDASEGICYACMHILHDLITLRIHQTRQRSIDRLTQHTQSAVA